MDKVEYATYKKVLDKLKEQERKEKEMAEKLSAFEKAEEEVKEKLAIEKNDFATVINQHKEQLKAKETALQELVKKEHNRAKAAAFQAELKERKLEPIDPKIMSLIKLDALAVSDNGEVDAVSLKTFVDAIHKENAFLFASTEGSGEVNNRQAPADATQKVDVSKLSAKDIAELSYKFQ